MPVDQKRINGPENTEPYRMYSNTSRQSFEKLLKESRKNKRVDGREPDDLRKIYMKAGVVSQAKGSAYIEMGNTKVIVSVFDPREIPNKNDYSLNGELYCEFKYAPFSCRKRRLHQRDSEEKECSVILRRALESAVCRHEFPNFQVDIYALVLENDGSALSAAITCAGLALAHAGVPMFDLVTAVTLGKQGENLYIDPTYDEEMYCSGTFIEKKDNKAKEHGIIVLSVLSTHQQISEIYQTGCLSLTTLTEYIYKLMECNQKIISLTERCLVQSVMKHLKISNVEEKAVDK